MLMYEMTDFENIKRIKRCFRRNLFRRADAVLLYRTGEFIFRKLVGYAAIGRVRRTFVSETRRLRFATGVSRGYNFIYFRNRE